MTELIIKVDDDFLREAKLKGMEEQFELVRCKDCKYWGDDHTCHEHSLVSPMGANEFCSRGERGDSE